MNRPVITPLPPAPSRNNDGPDFIAKADAFVAAWPDFGAEMNLAAEYVETVASQVDGAINAFPSRAEAEAATAPPSVHRITVAGLDYIRDPAGTALVTGDGAAWSPAGTVRPEHWGARGDGTTDDTAAIQAAIDWLAGTGGGHLLFRARRYIVSDTLQIPTNVWLIGEGWRFQGDYTNNAILAGTWIELAPGSDCDVILFRAQPGPGETVRQRLHAGMRDIGVHGRRSDSFALNFKDLNATGRGIRMEGVSYVTLDNVCAFRCADQGVSTGSFDYGGSVGTLSCNNMNWRNVVAIGNGSHGIEAFGGDSTYSQLVAGFNGGIGIRTNDGPLVGSLAWNNASHGVSISGAITVSACQSYDNGRNGFNVASAGVSLIGCAARNNGVTVSATVEERNGIFLAGAAQDVLIDGCRIDNRSTAAATQQRGIYSLTSGARVRLGTNVVRENALANVFFADPASVEYHSPGSAEYRHPGFTATGRIDMAGNRVQSVGFFSLTSWAAANFAGGTLALPQSMLCTADVAGSVTVTDLAALTGNGLPLVIIRNTNADPLTFEHATAKLRLMGAASKVLAQHETIMFVHVSGTVWQQVG